MAFDPSIFDVMNDQNPNQLVLDQLNQSIEEFHKNPQFAFALFESIKTGACKNEFQLKNVLITLKSNISRQWNTYGYWDQENRQAIISQIFEVLFTIPQEMRSFLTYIFDAISGKTSSYEQEWVSILIQLFDQNEKLEDVVSLIQIAFLWMRSHQRRAKVEEEIDVLMTTVVEKSKAAFDQVVDSVEENPSCALFATQFVKLSRYYMRCSTLAMVNGVPETTLEQIIPFLGISEDCEQKIELKRNVLKTIKMCISEYLGRQMTEISVSDERKAFIEHFRNDIVPPIIEAFKQFASAEHVSELMYYILYIINQILTYNLDESMVDENLFNIVIQQSILPENCYDDPVENPQLFIEQQMETRLVGDQTTTRLVSASIIFQLVKKYNIPAETIITYLAPDTEHDEPQILDSKIFLLCSLAKAVLSKQRTDYNLELKQSKKDKTQIDDFEPSIPLPAEYAELCTTIIEADSIPIFLILSAIHLLSKLIIFIDTEKGVELSLTILQSEYVSQTPLIAVYAAKLFNKCAKYIDDFSSIDFSEVISPILEASKEVQSKALYNMLTILIKKAPESMESVVTDIVEYYCDVIENVVLPDEDSRIYSAYDILYNFILPFQNNIELLGETFERIFTTSIEKEAANITEFPSNRFYHLLSIYSLNYPTHPDEMYQAFMQLIELIDGNEDLIYDTATRTAKNFFLYAYPLIVDPESAVPNTQEFHDAVVSLTVKLFEKYHSDEVDVQDEDELAFILMLMAVIVQKYGIIPEFLAAGLSEMASQIEENKGDVNKEITKSIILLFSSAINHDQAAVAQLMENEAVTFYLIENCDSDLLPSFNLLKHGTNLLLALVRNGVAQAFPAAVKCLSDLEDMKEEDEESQESDSEDNGEEEDEDDDERKSDEDESDADKNDDAEEEEENKDSGNAEDEEDNDDDGKVDSDIEDDSDDEKEGFTFSYALPQDSITIMNQFQEILAANESIIETIEDEEERTAFVEKMTELNGECPF